MKTMLIAVFAALIVLGLGASPAFSLEPSDGGITEGDQDPEFNDGAAFDAILGVEDDQNSAVDEEGATPDRVRRVGIIGIWQYTERHAGWFAAKLYVRVKGRRVLIGRMKGIFRKSESGRREMAGVILDRAGKYRGKIVGLYGRRGWVARWSVDGGDRTGKAKAKFVAPFGRAGFVGKAIVPAGELDTGDEE
jgi:hypothetical protein